MVSFNCDACFDVIKKPKLDQHRNRCQSSFTCLDCSKTFPTPADYKGHISCISEAEKYEKSMYQRPPQNGWGRGGSNGNQWGRGGFTNRGGRGGNPAGRGRWGPVNYGTGVNDIPLGSESKMWTPTSSTPEPVNGEKKNPEPTTSHTMATLDRPTQQKLKTTEPDVDITETRNKEKTAKKRKSAEDVVEGGTPSALTLPEPEDAAEKQKKKKSKKSKSSRDVDAEKSLPTTEIANDDSLVDQNAPETEDSHKHKKDKRKDKLKKHKFRKEDPSTQHPSSASETAVEIEPVPPLKASSNKQLMAEPTSEIPEVSEGKEKRKEKKRKRKEDSEKTPPADDTQKMHKKHKPAVESSKKKKSRSQGVSQEV